MFEVAHLHTLFYFLPTDTIASSKSLSTCFCMFFNENGSLVIMNGNDSLLYLATAMA